MCSHTVYLVNAVFYTFCKKLSFFYVLCMIKVFINYVVEDRTVFFIF